MATARTRASTPATTWLDRARLPYETIAYAYDPNAPEKGLQAAQAMGVAPERVFKTLMVMIDRTHPACVVIPVARRLALKRVASVLNGKSAAMMLPAEAERITGYKTGGISPFGQKKRVPGILDDSARAQESIYVNAGQRGLQCLIAPALIVEQPGWQLATVSEA